MNEYEILVQELSQTAKAAAEDKFAYLLRRSAISIAKLIQPIQMILHCPWCSARHIDRGEYATKVHHTHSCQTCGHTWRPAVVPTVGVQFLPGFKNKPVEEIKEHPSTMEYIDRIETDLLRRIQQIEENSALAAANIMQRVEAIESIGR